MTKTRATTNSDPTKGVRPIVEDAAGTVVLGGKEYTVRRLNVRDTFRLARLLATGAGAATLSGGVLSGSNMSVEKIIALILSAVAYGEKNALDFLGSLIGLSGDDFGDLPIGSELEVLRVLGQGQDLKAWWDAFLALLESNPALKKAMEEERKRQEEMAKRSQELSTSFPTGTD